MKLSALVIAAIGALGLACSNTPVPPGESSTALTTECPAVGSACHELGSDRTCVVSGTGPLGFDSLQCWCADSKVACRSYDCYLDGGVTPSGCCACPSGGPENGLPSNEFGCLCEPPTPPATGCNNPNGVGDDNGKCKGHAK